MGEVTCLVLLVIFMAVFTDKKDIQTLREAGKRLAGALLLAKKAVKPGVTTGELDRIAREAIEAGGDVPAFLNYKPSGASYPYPATLCVSVNNEVVHGIPGDRVLQEGDIVGLDIGLSHKGVFVDMAETVPVGKVSEVAERLMRVTEESLKKAIAAVRPGGRIGDIGAAVVDTVKAEKNFAFSIVEILGGHGVGEHVHEDPFIPNIGTKGKGPKITAGMVLALEPIINEGTKHVVLDRDGYTWKTKDAKLSAHFEHTILVTEKGAEIITVL